MKQLFFLLLCAWFLGGCVAGREGRRAEKAAAKEAVRVSQLAPDQQLTELVTKHPELIGSVTRVVVEHDTIRLPGKTVQVQVPVVSTEKTDNALIDSLLSAASGQLKHADSVAFAARMKLVLSQRPKLSRDTSTFTFEGLTVKTWTDSKGVVRVKVIRAEQKVAFEKTVKETGPLQPAPPSLTFWEKVVFVLRSWFWLILILIVLGCLWVFRKFLPW